MRKNLFIFIAILTATMVMANGQFEKAMAQNIGAMFTANDAESLQSTINKLNRIGEAEKNRWEPYYYVAFGYVRMSGMYESGIEKDKYLDLAMEAVEKGEAIQPDDSELEALKGYVNMIKLAVDPASRGMSYSGLAMASFNKAIQLDPNNPRAHFLLGRMQHGTAQFMGGDFTEACASFSKAKELFSKASDASNTIAPSWGEEVTDRSIEQICGEGE